MIRLSSFVKNVSLKATRSVGTYTLTTWEEKERSHEKQYMLREEAKLLKKMNEKLTRERYLAEVEPSGLGFRDKEIKVLKDIFRRYKVNTDSEDALFEELYAWKYQE